MVRFDEKRLGFDLALRHAPGARMCDPCKLLTRPRFGRRCGATPWQNQSDIKKADAEVRAGLWKRP
jgi:hypothetical protein